MSVSGAALALIGMWLAVGLNLQVAAPAPPAGAAVQQLAAPLAADIFESDPRPLDLETDPWALFVAPPTTPETTLPTTLSERPAATLHLTFDDGPHPVYTPQILDILAWFDARATFFVTGWAVTTYPEVIARIVSEGHTLANHTWDHVALDTLSAEEFEDTVLRTQRALGEHATACLRPPYYRANAETYQHAARLGLQVVMGDVRPQDWRLPGAMTIADRIIGGAAPDAVVVLHDGGGDRSQTVEGLRLALAYLEAQYSFEPVCG